MSRAEPNPRASDATEAGGDPETVEALAERGDVPGLLAIAKAYRTGQTPGGVDMQRCFAAYSAAADLGSNEAADALALFYMTGRGTAQDLERGTTLLRASAERGSVTAKVYLGNLYEEGIHYHVDHGKADVWYRSAARAAGITSAEDTPERIVELAELGCSRYVRMLLERDELSADERKRLLLRARSLGHGLSVRASQSDAVQEHGADVVPDDLATKSVHAPAARAASKPKTHAPVPSRTTARSRGRTLAFTLLFLVAGWGTAMAAAAGSHELDARHIAGMPSDLLVFVATLALVGVLPMLLVYRTSAIAKAIVCAALTAFVSFLGHPIAMFRIFEDVRMQSAVFGYAGFALAMLLQSFVETSTKPTSRRALE